MHVLEDAIEISGLTQAEFAKAIGKVDANGNGRQSYVSMLLHRVKTKKRPIPLEICPAIEEVTHGRVTRKMMRPDFPWELKKRKAA